MDSVSRSNGSNSRGEIPTTNNLNGRSVNDEHFNDEDDDSVVEGFSDTESSDSEFDSISSSSSSSSATAVHNPDGQKNGLQLAKDAVAKIVGNVHMPECTLSCQARRCIGGSLLFATGIVTGCTGLYLMLDHSKLELMMYPNEFNILFFATFFLFSPGLLCSCVSVPICMARDDD